MVDIKERSRSHFREQLANPMKSIVVPEWSDGEDKAVIYYREVMTLEQDGRIWVATEKSPWEGIVETLIQRALKENGEKLYAATDRTQLLTETDRTILYRIVQAMNSNSPSVINEERLEEIEGN